MHQTNTGITSVVYVVWLWRLTVNFTAATYRCPFCHQEHFVHAPNLKISFNFSKINLLVTGTWHNWKKQKLQITFVIKMFQRQQCQYILYYVHLMYFSWAFNFRVLKILLFRYLNVGWHSLFSSTGKVKLKIHHNKTSFNICQDCQLQLKTLKYLHIKLLFTECWPNNASTECMRTYWFCRMEAYIIHRPCMPW